MSTRTLLIETASRIFSDACDKALWDSAETGQFPEALWGTLGENGFLGLGLPDSGAELGDLFAVLKEAGRHAVPLGLAEAMLANRWLGADGERISVGIAAEGGVADVPWGRTMDKVVGITPGSNRIAVAQVSADGVTEAANLAGESRDRIAVANAAEKTLEEPPYELLALSRVVQMAGALERVLEMALQYAGEREQFGRPISKFQAIQHLLAVVAAEVAASSRAADAAVDALPTGRFVVDLAAAKARVGEAAGRVAEIVHQVHGAMGFTHEHQLHHFTRRLWAWRDEFGNERTWQIRLGREVARSGADGLWSLIATRG